MLKAVSPRKNGVGFSSVTFSVLSSGVSIATSSAEPSPALNSEPPYVPGDEGRVLARGLGVHSPQPRVLEVLRRDGVSVRPLHSVAQGEDVGQLVVADLNALGHRRPRLLVLVEPVETFHHVVEHGAGDRVGRGRGVQVGYLGLEVEPQRVRAPPAALLLEGAAAHQEHQAQDGERRRSMPEHQPSPGHARSFGDYLLDLTATLSSGARPYRSFCCVFYTATVKCSIVPCLISCYVR